MTKIDIVSGFLGAGKTTLIKKLLNEVFVGEQVVLIENEFGEIGIDGGFLKEAGIQIREMNSGCICCSLVGDFGDSLKEVITTYHPDRILIEPSGVGKLSDVIKAVQGVQAAVEVELNSYTTVVDVLKCKLYQRNFGEFFNNQIEYAGAIILSRTDKATQAQIADVMEMMRSMNEKATMITTPIAELQGHKILEAMEGVPSLEEELLAKEVCPECGGHHDHEHHDHEHQHHHEHTENHGCCGHHEYERHHEEHEHHHEEHKCGHDHHHDHHHADEVFTSWGKETAKAYTKDEISRILTALSEETAYGTILRAKGMVAGAEGKWIYFDMVPGEQEVRDGAAQYTGRICVIGAKIEEEKLAKLFAL